MSQALQRRLRSQQARVLVRSWEYRQRHHARGVWFDLRQLLTGMSAAYTVQADDVAALTAEGCPLDPVGLRFDPPKSIFIVPAESAARIPLARQVPMRLGGDLLAARHLVLTPFEQS